MALYEAGRGGGSFAEGIEVVLRAMLQAPAFLYRIEGRPGTPGAPVQSIRWRRWTDTRWPRGCPTSCGRPRRTTRLLAAAERNELGTTGQIETAARRMLADPRARPVVVEFHRQWLGLSALDRLAKDARRLPGVRRGVACGHARRDRRLRRGGLLRTGAHAGPVADRRAQLRHPGAGPTVRGAAAIGIGTAAGGAAPRSAGRPADPGGVPGGARAARPELARAPGQAGARADPVSADAAPAARVDGDAARGRPAAAHARALRPARQRSPVRRLSRADGSHRLRLRALRRPGAFPRQRRRGGGG